MSLVHVLLAASDFDLTSWIAPNQVLFNGVMLGLIVRGVRRRHRADLPVDQGHQLRVRRDRRVRPRWSSPRPCSTGAGTTWSPSWWSSAGAALLSACVELTVVRGCSTRRASSCSSRRSASRSSCSCCGSCSRNASRSGSTRARSRSTGTSRASASGVSTSRCSCSSRSSSPGSGSSSPAPGRVSRSVRRPTTPTPRPSPRSASVVRRHSCGPSPVALAGARSGAVGPDQRDPGRRDRHAGRRTRRCCSAALAAALIGGMVSIPLALVGGVIVGVLESLLYFNVIATPVAGRHRAVRVRAAVGALPPPAGPVGAGRDRRVVVLAPIAPGPSVAAPARLGAATAVARGRCSPSCSPRSFLSVATTSAEPLPLQPHVALRHRRACR